MASNLLVTISNGQDKRVSFREYIMESVPSRVEIDVFLHGTSWAKFDAQTGYRLGNYMPHDGLANSSTLSTTQANGARRSFMYTGKRSRINTYGNSFTQCHQVSDGETWQEYLAASIGEPVRNFGMGGFGVNQSYLRMLQEETGNSAADNIVFYIWGDDHIRSLLRCRYMLIKDWMKQQERTEKKGAMFHGNFWSNIEMDMEKGILVEKQNILPVADSLYKMTDPKWMYGQLKDDLALQMALFKRGDITDIDFDQLRKLGGYLGVNIDLEKESDKREAVGRLLDVYAFSATKFILGKVRDFCQKNNKKLLIVIFDPYQVTRPLLQGHPTRYDQPIVDFLQSSQFNYFDMNLVHLQDFKTFNISIDEYYKRYFIGHYNPSGNHFFAFAIKPHIVAMLDPKPITYLDSTSQIMDFKGYLDGY